MFVQKLGNRLDSIENTSNNIVVKMLCSHIKQIVGTSERKAEIVFADLENGFSIEDLDKKIEKAATKEGKKAVCPPWVAETVICEFFGLPLEDEQLTKEQPVKKKVVDLADLI